MLARLDLTAEERKNPSCVWSEGRAVVVSVGGAGVQVVSSGVVVFMTYGTQRLVSRCI